MRALMELLLRCHCWGQRAPMRKRSMLWSPRLSMLPRHRIMRLRRRLSRRRPSSARRPIPVLSS